MAITEYVDFTITGGRGSIATGNINGATGGGGDIITGWVDGNYGDGTISVGTGSIYLGVASRYIVGNVI